jgi:hypothetical protein
MHFSHLLKRRFFYGSKGGDFMIKETDTYKPMELGEGGTNNNDIPLPTSVNLPNKNGLPKDHITQQQTVERPIELGDYPYGK